MLNLLAHSGHGAYEYLNDQNILEEFLENEWYIVIPAYLLVLAMVSGIVYVVSKKSLSAVFFTLLVIFLLVGVLGYSVSPALSVFSIAGGFAMAFITIFGGALNKK